MFHTSVSIGKRAQGMAWDVLNAFQLLNSRLNDHSPVLKLCICKNAVVLAGKKFTSCATEWYGWKGAVQGLWA